MKKIVFLVLCFALMGTAAFSLDKAAGGGGLVWIATNTEIDDSIFAGGAFGFFGLGRYVELNVGVIGMSEGDLFGIGAGAYGKYPFSLSDKFVLFPTAGLDFEAYFVGDYSVTQMWIRGGAGIDYFFTDTMFLRSHLVYGVLVPISSEVVGTTHGALIKIGVGWMF
jgi:hypothetical protein